MHDVFISFSFKDQEKVEEIVNKLLNTYGITYWICTREIRAGKRYKKEIYHAIAEASAFVLIQTRNAVQSEEIPKEVSLAIEHSKTIIPFVIDDSKLSDDLAYDLAGLQRVDGTKPTFDERIGELAQEICKVIGKPVSMIEKSPTRTLASILPDQAPHFMGRDQEIEQIHEELSKHNKLFLQGFGGIGKSELAVAYAHRYREEYDTVVFAKYETSLRMLLSDDSKFAIDRFSRSAEENDEQYFKRKLNMLRQIATPRMLIIIDNFDVNTDPDLGTLREGNYTLLFTTRNEHDDSLRIPTLHIHEMNEEMQLALFRKYCPLFSGEEDTAKIQEILKLIGGHTLTIELVAKLMKNKRQAPKKMLAQLQEGNLAALSGTVVYRSQDTVYAFVRQLFNLSALNEEALQILMDLSLMPLDGVGFDEYLDWSGQEDAGNVTNLIESGWILAKDIDENGTTQTIALHPMIAEVVEQECKPDLDKCHVMFTHLTAEVKRRRHEGMEYLDALRYGNILLSIYQKCPIIYAKYHEAYDTILEVFIHIGLYMTAIELGEKLLNRRIEILDENDKLIGIVYYYLGDIYFYIDNYEKGLSALSKALAIFKNSAPNSIDYAYLIKYDILRVLRHINTASIAEKPIIQFDVDKIQELFSECERAFHASTEEAGLLTKGRKTFIGSLNHAYALFYTITGEYDKALQHAIASYQYFSAPEYLEDKPWVNSPLSSMSLAYAYKGDAENAVKYAKKAISVTEEYYPQTHYRVLRQRQYLAQTYHILRQYDDERKTLVELKELMEKEEIYTFMYEETVKRIEELKNKQK